MITDTVTRAITDIKDFEHSPQLTDIFKQVTRPLALQNIKNDGMAKMHSGVMIASNTPQEIDVFAKSYAAIMNETGVTQQNSVHTVTWDDLLKNDGATYHPHLNVKSAFTAAAGGVLLITGAFDKNNTFPERIENDQVFSSLCEQIDKADIMPSRVLQEKADKPVVILTGTQNGLGGAYKKETTPFMWRFPYFRVGV